MAKGGVSGKNGRDSNSQRLGIKCFSGEVVKAGDIILRQRGTKFKPGLGVGLGTDFTIYAKMAGKVNFRSNGAVSVIALKAAD